MECKVRAAGKTDPPQDCDMPFCGCNPAWTEALASAQESGWLPERQLVERLEVVQGQLREMHDAARAYIAAHGAQRVRFQDAETARVYEAAGIRLEELCGLRSAAGA